ncbi:hypothetical protein AB7G19_17135 [Bradyrhizobium sp. 215_C5_N1_1]|uniref:hypothetical protein n=1 Tax=unclassified Bradyrhizobium TaxID=2631580 RepID=UPI003F8BF82C
MGIVTLNHRRTGNPLCLSSHAFTAGQYRLAPKSACFLGNPYLASSPGNIGRMIFSGTPRRRISSASVKNSLSLSRSSVCGDGDVMAILMGQDHVMLTLSTGLGESGAAGIPAIHQHAGAPRRPTRGIAFLTKSGSGCPWA